VSLSNRRTARAEYIEALHVADRHDLQPMIDFAKA